MEVTPIIIFFLFVSICLSLITILDIWFEPEVHQTELRSVWQTEVHHSQNNLVIKILWTLIVIICPILGSCLYYIVNQIFSNSNETVYQHIDTQSQNNYGSIRTVRFNVPEQVNEDVIEDNPINENVVTEHVETNETENVENVVMENVVTEHVETNETENVENVVMKTNVDENEVVVPNETKNVVPKIIITTEASSLDLVNRTEESIRIPADIPADIWSDDDEDVNKTSVRISIYPDADYDYNT